MNKSRKPYASLALAIAATAAIGASAFAQPAPDAPRDGRPGAHTQHMYQKDSPHRHHSGPRGHEHGRFEHMRGLNLTEAQRDKIFEIRHAAAPEARQAMKEVAEARKALQEVARADQFDEAKAKAAADRQGAAIAKASLLRVKTQSQIHAVLTPEQRQQLEQRFARRQAPGKGPQAQAPEQAKPAS